jgi:Ser/Thr protein kinase RdoA (MazF antagonist)
VNPAKDDFDGMASGPRQASPTRQAGFHSDRPAGGTLPRAAAAHLACAAGRPALPAGRPVTQRGRYGVTQGKGHRGPKPFARRSRQLLLSSFVPEVSQEAEPADRASWSPELTETIQRRYGLTALKVGRDLGGGYNLNLLAHTDPGDLIIRVFRPWVTQARLAGQQQVRRYLGDRGWPVAPLRPASDGNGFVRAGDRLAEVEGYVPGGSPMNTWSALRAGMPWLARLHDALAGMPVPQAARTAPVANHVATGQVVELVETAGRSIADWGLGKHEQRYLSAARQLADKLAARETFDVPSQLVHGDFWDNNVFLEGDRLVLLTDFDFLGVRPRVDDLALTLFFANEQAGRDDRSADRVAQLRHLADAYDGALEQPLSPQERADLPYAMARSPLTFLRDMAATGPAGRSELTALRGPEYQWGLQVLDSRVWLDGFLAQ